MAKKDDDKGRANHSGSVAAEDSELTTWLHRLWHRNEPPERIELWQMFGRNKVVRGEMIHHEDFRPSEKLDVEQANKLANEIMAAAQNDCDSVRREAWYQIAVIDRNRKSSPLVRRIGPLQPKRTYAIARSGGFDPDGNGDGDDEQFDIKNIEISQIKTGFDEVRWDKQRNDRVLGEMLLLQDSIIKDQRTFTGQLMHQVMDFFGRLQEAEDRKLQRDIVLAKEKFKIDLMEEGMRSARNLLPGLFAGAKAGTNGNGNGATNGHDEGNDVAFKDYGSSAERTLADNFLHDCEKAGIDIALFGDFKEHEGKLALVTPGIFSIKQFYILTGVRDGRLPIHTLDELMPNSGHINAITEEQIKKARDAGVTDGIGMALFEIVGLRQRAAAAREAAANRVTNPATTPEERP